MKTFLAFVIGIVLGIAAIYYFKGNKESSRVESAQTQVESAQTQVESAVKSAGETIEDKLRSLNLRSGDITNELARTGRVIRQKAREAGQAIAEASADLRT